MLRPLLPNAPGLTAALALLLAASAAAQPPRPLDARVNEAAETARAFPGAAIFNDQPPFLAGVAVDRSDATYRAGEKLRVQFLGEVDAHLYLLYHQADGTSVLLFPNAAHRNSKVAGQQPMVIPQPGEEFRFRVRPPLGREVLQVLAATAPIVELEALVGKSRSAPQVEAKLLAALAERLQQDRSTWTEQRALITTIAAEAQQPERKAARIGLFIGIGEYQRPEFAPTHEELRHSAEVMHELLLKHGGLDPERTLLVRDAEATKPQLQKLISEWLPSVSQPGDTVFIYFSGHAGQMETGDPQEPDGQEESLGPYDLEGGRPGETRAQILARVRATNISDDTLAAWLSRLQGRQVVLILDTCFSGGVVEGKALGKSFWVDEAARTKDISQLNTLVLSSCAADEQSLFAGTKNKTMWFTYCLAEAIDRAAAAGKGPLTVQEAYDYSRRRMRVLIDQANAPREQEPTMTDRILLPVVLVP
jgi:hypothetical protein